MLIDIYNFFMIKIYGRNIFFKLFFFLYEAVVPKSLEINEHGKFIAFNVSNRLDQISILKNLEKHIGKEIRPVHSRRILNFALFLRQFRVYQNRNIFVFSLTSIWDVIMVSVFAKSNNVVLVQHCSIEAPNGLLKPSQLYYRVLKNCKMFAWEWKNVDALVVARPGETIKVPEIAPTESPLIGGTSDKADSPILILSGVENRAKNSEAIKFMQDKYCLFYIKPHPSDKTVYENRIDKIPINQSGIIYSVSYGANVVLEENNFDYVSLIND